MAAKLLQVDDAANAAKPMELLEIPEHGGVLCPP
jgi:hypothetical protein